VDSALPLPFCFLVWVTVGLRFRCWRQLLLAVDCDLAAGGLCFAFAVLFLGLGYGDLRFRCWRRLLLAVHCDLAAGGLCFAFAVLFLGLGYGDLRFRCWRRLLLVVDRDLAAGRLRFAFAILFLGLTRLLFCRGSHPDPLVVTDALRARDRG
jgi:hypothetical protein